MVRFLENMAVKFGRDSELLVEAETMQVLHAHLGASVPCVFSTLIEDCPQEDAPATKRYYLILEYILGKSYLEESPPLTPAEKADIQRQLRSMMDELRAIPSPGYYGRVGRRPLYDLILNYYDREGPTMRDPFATEEDLNNGIILLTDRLPNQFHARVHRRSSSDSLAWAPAASTSWQTVGFFVHTLGIRWPFGLSVALDVVFGAFGDGTIAHLFFSSPDQSRTRRLLGSSEPRRPLAPVCGSRKGRSRHRTDLWVCWPISSMSGLACSALGHPRGSGAVLKPVIGRWDYDSCVGFTLNILGEYSTRSRGKGRYLLLVPVPCGT